MRDRDYDDYADEYGDDYDDEDGSRWQRVLSRWPVGVVVIAVILGAYLVVRDDSKTSGAAGLASLPSLSLADTTAGEQLPNSSLNSLFGEEDTDSSLGGPTGTTTSVPRVAQLPLVPPADSAEPTTSEAGSSSASTVTTGAPASGGPVVTLPDGSPVPVVVVYEQDRVTLTGAVPSAAAAARLEFIAVAASKVPAVAANSLTIDPDVPANVSVRFVDLNSVGFPAAGATIEGEYADDLSRLANIVKAAPNVSVLVIGYSDDGGTEGEEFVVSDARSRAVVNYLVSTGVEADRISSRVVSAADLASLDDEVADALNRRAELNMSGLLIEADT